MTRIFVVCAMVAAIAVPVALAGDPAPSQFKNAAAYCKALRTSKGVAAFEAQFGTNENKRNAFGKCVSSIAKAKPDKGDKTDDDKAEKSGQADDDDQADKDEEARANDAAVAKAKLACAKLKADNPAKFAQQHKNLGRCKKALRAKS